MNYKNELFLIKGRYYTWFGQGGYGSLEYRGAVEGSIVVDDSTELSKYLKPFDVILAGHDGKWGVFPAIEICGCEDALYASDDSKPFIYDDWMIVRNGESRADPETYEAFILFRKEGLWNAFRVTRDSAIRLFEEEGLVSETPEALIEKLEGKYGIRLHIRLDRNSSIDGVEAPEEFDEEASAEFDVEKDFLRPYYPTFADDLSMYAKNVRLIQMAIGLERYTCGKSFIYAAAHKDPYAAVLLGRDLFIRLREVSEKRKQDKEAFNEEGLEAYDAMLDTCLGYLRLGKQYADEKGDKTIGDIAVALYEYACGIPRFVVRKSNGPGLRQIPYLKKNTGDKQV